MADFIPHSISSLVSWLKNFQKQLVASPAIAGITPEEATTYSQKIDTLLKAIDDADAAEKQLRKLQAQEQATRTQTITDIRVLANFIKNSKNYTEATGKLFDIIGSGLVAHDATTAKPSLTISVKGGHIVIAFTKGSSNGVKLYGKRGSEASFSFLAIDTHSPYHDNRPNQVDGIPEKRDYYAWYIDKEDATYGQQSDTISITI